MLKLEVAKRTLLILMLLTATFTVAGNIGFSPAFLQQIADEYGFWAKRRVASWQELVEKHVGDSETEAIEAANDFFNDIDYRSDAEHWGKNDYWATPVEMLASGAGDCEDYSIAKYFTLIELGIPEQRLRITYVKAIRLNQAHMVLAYYPTPESEPLILDNLNDRILPASRRRDLVPVYSFNGSDLWMSKERGKGNLIAGGAARINIWRDMLLRFQKERDSGISFTASAMSTAKE